MGDHNDAVRSLINGTQRQNEVETTYADNIGRYPDPDPISGEVPDIVFEFSNGHTTIVEVDTKPMSDHDETQDEAFQRSASQQSATTYEHYFANDVLN
jgi:hypothetical protein